MEPDLDRTESFGRRLVHRWLHRRTLSSPEPVAEARIVAIASGKGGTGKSFLATNLAIALHRAGRRVGVVDCDFGLGNAHLLFGVNPRLSIYHLLQGLAPPAAVLTPTPHGPGLVAGGSGISSLSDLDERHFAVLARGLGLLARQHDTLLLDCAAGLSPQSLSTILAAEQFIVVTNPEIAALTDAYALIKCLARQQRPPMAHVVVNRVTARGEGRPTFERLAEVARRFAGCTLHYLGEILEDRAVTQRRLGQPPLIVSHPECETSRAIREVQENLEEVVGPLIQGAPPGGHGVERRLTEILRRR